VPSTNDSEKHRPINAAVAVGLPCRPRRLDRTGDVRDVIGCGLRSSPGSREDRKWPHNPRGRGSGAPSLARDTRARDSDAQRTARDRLGTGFASCVARPSYRTQARTHSTADPEHFRDSNGTRNPTIGSEPMGRRAGRHLRICYLRRRWRSQDDARCRRAGLAKKARQGIVLWKRDQ